MTEVLTPGADRAVAAVRALGRAEQGTTAAVAMLRAADDVDWTGPGAAAYHEALATLLDGVLRVRVRLRDAEHAVAEHAVAVRAHEARVAAAARAAGFPALPVQLPAHLPVGPPADLLVRPLLADRWAVP
jgi:hypothetical protein